MPLARLLRRLLCVCASSDWIVWAACAPVSLPFIFIAESACSHGAWSGPAVLLAFAMASKKVSSIRSMLASASFIGFSVRPTPVLTNCCSALRLASTACSSAASMPASALPSIASTSTALAGLRAAPSEAAPATS